MSDDVVVDLAAKRKQKFSTDAIDCIEDVRKWAIENKAVSIAFVVVGEETCARFISRWEIIDAPEILCHLEMIKKTVLAELEDYERSEDSD